MGTRALARLFAHRTSGSAPASPQVLAAVGALFADDSGGGGSGGGGGAVGALRRSAAAVLACCHLQGDPGVPGRSDGTAAAAVHGAAAAAAAGAAAGAADAGGGDVAAMRTLAASAAVAAGATLARLRLRQVMLGPLDAAALGAASPVAARAARVAPSCTAGSVGAGAGAGAADADVEAAVRLIATVQRGWAATAASLAAHGALRRFLHERVGASGGV